MNRREFIRLSVLTTGAILSGGIFSESSASGPKIHRPVPDSEVKAMLLDLSYATEMVVPPKLGDLVRFWIPLLQTDQEQEISSMGIESPIPFKMTEEGLYKNKMVFVEGKFKKGDSITLTYKLKRKRSGTIIDKREDMKRHLVLTEREKWDQNIIRFVDKVVGDEKRPLEVGRRIFNALVDYLTYDKTIPGCGLGISTWTFENKAGRCDDFHALFRTMMIYKGIPVRWEQGFPLPYPSAMTRSGKFEGDCTGAHCWVRFYIGDGQWVPVDVSEANKRKDMREYFFGTISPNRFKVSTGRDIVLNPPQNGEPLNTYPYTHAEVDGVPLIYGHHYRNIIQYKLIGLEV